MSDYSKESKASVTVFIIVLITYTIICMAKAAFSASIVGIVSDGLFTKPKAGIINGAFLFFMEAVSSLTAGLLIRYLPIK